jgi:hypothetical protein
MRCRRLVPVLLAVAVALAAAPRANADPMVELGGGVESEPVRGSPVPLAVVPAQVDWLVPAAAVILGIFAVLIILNIRKAAQRRPAALDRIGVRPVADGFWLDAPDLAIGTRVRYRCTVAGAPREAWARLTGSPSGTLVYTGGTPSEIRLLALEEPIPGTELPPSHSGITPATYGTLDAPPPGGEPEPPAREPSEGQPPAS